MISSHGLDPVGEKFHTSGNEYSVSRLQQTILKPGYFSVIGSECMLYFAMIVSWVIIVL